MFFVGSIVLIASPTFLNPELLICLPKCDGVCELTDVPNFEIEFPILLEILLAGCEPATLFPKLLIDLLVATYLQILEENN